MIISFNIELTDIEQSVLNERLQRLGITADEWVNQIIVNRLDSLTRPHKMAKARELFDKFHAAPEDIKKKIMTIEIPKGKSSFR